MGLRTGPDVSSVSYCCATGLTGFSPSMTSPFPRHLGPAGCRGNIYRLPIARRSLESIKMGLPRFNRRY